MIPLLGFLSLFWPFTLDILGLDSHPFSINLPYFLNPPKISQHKYLTQKYPTNFFTMNPQHYFPCLHCHPQDYIRMVQHLIERCLLFHMSRDDCINALAKHANINPIVTLTGSFGKSYLKRTKASFKHISMKKKRVYPKSYFRALVWMPLPVTEDTTVSSYWLNWRVLLCSIWLLSIMAISSFIIWKYESLDNLRSDEGETQQDAAQFLCNDDAWRPCLKDIHPFWLLVFRVIAFCFLLATLIVRILSNESRIFYFYTQWTFVLVTFYFGFGSLLSIYGCYQYHKISSGNLNVQHGETDAEQGNFMPLTNGENANKHEMRNVLNTQEKSSPAIISCLFQIVYQMSAGAVILTDCVYWLIIFPFLTASDYKLSFVRSGCLNQLPHSVLLQCFIFSGCLCKLKHS
ncbi:hypothetical protein Pint_02763 [Pistacia integerrima]|uniref:Uncharacterized protein n=1 Tax=Pistacia integerrima TaxID=434235 RepID=A0ACC0ZNA3_9ROSI|nr:hypothetical protein Pint_02763 [Pistacia integerrima]